MSEECLIVAVDRTHDSDWPVFWAPNRCGYTSNLDRAGRYSKEEAEAICKNGEYQHEGKLKYDHFLITPEDAEKISMRVCDRDSSIWSKLMQEGRL